MGNLKQQIIIVGLALAIAFTAAACGGCNSGSKGMTKEAYKEYKKMMEQADKAEAMLNALSDIDTPEELREMMDLAESLQYNYDPLGMEPSAATACEQLKQRVVQLKKRLEGESQYLAKKQVVWVVQESDHLIESSTTYPIYLERGDQMVIDIQLQKATNVKVYNADSRQVVKSYNSKLTIHDTLPITNKAIYLLEIGAQGTQYAEIAVGYTSQNLDHLLYPKTVSCEVIEGKKGDFQAKSVNGITMHNIFEEPRKFTLRGQIKSFFSGTSRALVAINVPSGATDILYSLRISTNEKPNSSDGEFKDNMQLSYHKVRLLGLPLYESSRGAGIISTILGDNVPVRDEDAYINLYVFFNSGQAKKFQDGEATSNLKYSVEYSTLGTQSCNGRIPAKGHSTIYLGFENERMRYNNYIWLEALASMPKTEYLVSKYSID